MSDSSGDAEIPTVSCFLVLLVPGPNIQAGAEHFAAHVAFIETMEASNVVLLGGEFEATVEGAEAAYLLHVASSAEAESWARKDPLVKYGVYRSRIVKWNLVGIARNAIAPAFDSQVAAPARGG